MFSLPKTDDVLVQVHTDDEGLDDLQLDDIDEGEETNPTIEETLGNTAGSKEDWLNDNTDDISSTPQAPAAQMRFDTFEAAKEHCRAYAQRKGFGIQIDYSRNNSKGEQYKVNLVCTKAGKPHEEKEDTQITSSCVKKRKKNTNPRNGCLAHMFVKKREAWWYVERCTDQHNHPLIIKPSLTRFLRVHQNIPVEEKRFLRILHA